MRSDWHPRLSPALSPRGASRCRMSLALTASDFAPSEMLAHRASQNARRTPTRLGGHPPADESRLFESLERPHRKGRRPRLRRELDALPCETGLDCEEALAEAARCLPSRRPISFSSRPTCLRPQLGLPLLEPDQAVRSTPFERCCRGLSRPASASL